ncbi:uncharacterized protein ARMOST_07765 [Armillaria ostoyae]|uniref:Uncharacterized protein n=1 Tax=Armillaria ostoyae TaxID=47428 RepID=A0A284R6T7_ARMOS|nr:uncharacterized protein ARMOST_07765 [Armillaria ostoyae]
MRPSAARLIRFVPRSSVQLTQKVVPSPAERPPEVKPPTLLDILLERKEKAGDNWPSNIRVETPISKAALKDVHILTGRWPFLYRATLFSLHYALYPLGYTQGMNIIPWHRQDVV